MGGGLLNDVARFLTQLEAVQQDLQRLFERKRRALTGGLADELLLVAREETSLVQKLQDRLALRGEILAKAQRAGFRSRSLRELAAEIDEAGTETIAFRIDAARKTSESLRRESWVQWIVAQRSCRQYADLIDLIIHNGKRSPTYGRQSTESQGAGTLLDASA